VSLRLRVPGGRVGPLYGLVVRSRRGRRTRRRAHRVPQELGSSCRLRVDRIWFGVTSPKTPGLKPASGLRERTQAHGAVSPSEGNEARRNGRQEVGALHSTAEAGEQQPSEPCGGKGVPSHGPVGGKHARRFVASQRVHGTPTDSGVAHVGGSLPPACGIIRGRRAVCLNWARTDLREARRATAGLTRPFFANLPRRHDTPWHFARTDIGCPRSRAKNVRSRAR
jgi:hypothetical protein